MATDNRPNDGGENGDDAYIIEDTGESLADFKLPEGGPAPAASGIEPAGAGDELESLREESRKARDQYLRTLADFENFRKRSEREKNDFFKFALSHFVTELLPVLDNFERAVSHAPSASAEEEFIRGIELIYKQLWDVLQKNGLRSIDEAGVQFDPNLHEAVVREEDDSVPSHTVKEILQKGYFLNDRLVRPAMVRVTVGGKESGSSS